ncbi:hypothetical protein HD806DRAFT_232492 [Xylariaceae sp. AK1471]|nr:hypothetical protein HD806DRAFT_232492 [Xylariaceae sp. AK1471]
MTKPGSISLETIVNVVFGILACLIAIGGVIATIHAGNKQRHRPPDLELGFILRHKHTIHYVRQETLQTFDGYDYGYSFSSGCEKSNTRTRACGRVLK